MIAGTESGRSTCCATPAPGLCCHRYVTREAGCSPFPRNAREGERHGKRTDVLPTGGGRDGGVGGMRGGAASGLGGGGGCLSRQERQDGLHRRERRRDPLLAARTRRGSQDRSRRWPQTLLLTR